MRPFPDAQVSKALVSSDGGQYPRWSPDGSELFFVSLNNEFMSAEVVPGAAFLTRPPVVLFSSNDVPHGHIDVHPDGDRFLTLVQSNDSRGDVTLVIVQNFFDELQ